jgi:signal transduction histidine kinase
MRIVTEAIAHDLRLPLQRVKADLERAQSLDATAREQAFIRADEEIDGALATFNALIDITRAESGIGTEAFETVDLAKVAADVVELFEPVAEDKKQTLKRDVVPATISGQGTLIRQALGNLIQNAIKFSPEGASITVRLRETDQAAELSVEDTGPGIPAGDRATALRPFGRLARDAAADGKGLGLALVAACAKLHGGALRLEAAEPGLRAILDFPRG